MYLEVKNLLKYYNRSYPIIKDLTFSVKKGINGCNKIKILD